MNIKILAENIVNNPSDFTAEQIEKYFEDYVELRLSAVIKSLPDSDEIRRKGRELDEKDFAQWMYEIQKGNVL